MAMRQPIVRVHTEYAVTPSSPVPWFPRTKLQPPRQRSDLLERPRLVAPLRDALTQARLILIAAPAGAGKTTLLTELLSNVERRTQNVERSSESTDLARRSTFYVLRSAWVSLDADDNDLARFLAVLLAALDQLAPEAGISGDILAQSLAGRETDRTTQIRQVVASIINSFLDAPPVPGLLILDDLHTIDEPAIFTAIEYLIDQLPAHLTLAIATRNDPPLPLARLRARRELLELRLHELLFTVDETADLLGRRLGLPLSAAEMSALHTRTEGWAAGLSLLAASMAPLGSAEERDRFLKHLFKTDRYIFDYLAEEVLDRQDPFTRSFLLETAILPELTPHACQALTGRADAPAVLDELYRQNLFLVQMLADAPERTEQAAYRYHEIFRAFLLERLRRGAPEWLRELHRRAAGASRDPLRAIEHLLQAELWEDAANRIEAMGEHLLACRASRTIQSLIGALPEATRSTRPRLRYLLGAGALQDLELRSATALLEGAATDFARTGDTISQGAALVSLATALGQAGDLARAADTADRALLLPLAPTRRVQLLVGRAWQSLVGGSWRQAASDLDEAIAIVEQSGDSQACASLAVGMRGSLMGLPGGVARVSRLSRLVGTAVGPGDHVLHGAAAAMRAWANIWLDHWEEANAEGRRTLDLCLDTEAFANIRAEIYLQQPVYTALLGDTSLADEYFARMLAALEPEGCLQRTGRKIALLHSHARVRWLQERHEELRGTYRQMKAALPASVWPTDAALCREIGALILLDEGRTEEAIGELRLTATDQARLAVAPILGDPRLHLAHAYLQTGRLDEAIVAAGPAITAIRRENAPGRLRWQGPSIVIPILRLLAVEGPHADFASVTLEGLERRR